MFKRHLKPVRRFASRRLLPVLVVALVGAAVAAPTQAARPAGDSVRGTGTLSSGPTLKVNARSGPNGENPSGSLSLTQTGVGFLKADVECLRVVANTAYIGVVITRHFEPSLVGQRTVYIITDTNPDTFNSTGAQDSNCNNLALVPTPAGVVTQGDIVVTDSP